MLGLWVPVQTQQVITSHCCCQPADDSLQSTRDEFEARVASGAQCYWLAFAVARVQSKYRSRSASAGLEDSGLTKSSDSLYGGLISQRKEITLNGYEAKSIIYEDFVAGQIELNKPLVEKTA